MRLDRVPSVGHTVVGEVWATNAKPGIEFDPGICGWIDQRGMPEAATIYVDCERPGTFELRVSMGDVADAFDIECVAPAKVDGQAPRPEAPLRTIVGGVIVPSLLFYAANGDVLWGQPQLAAKDPEVLSVAYGSSAITTKKPAREPIVMAGDLEYALPIEIVDVPWRLELTAPRYDAVNDVVEVTALAIESRCGLLQGLAGCQFTTYRGDVATKRESNGACQLLAPRSWKLDDRVCVSAHGQTSCADLPK